MTNPTAELLQSIADELGDGWAVSAPHDSGARLHSPEGVVIWARTETYGANRGKLSAYVVCVLADPESGTYWCTVRRLTETARARDEYRDATTTLDDVELAGRIHAVRKPSR